MVSVILCSFNNSDQLPEAIELLLEYYSKRPDLFNEVYTAFIREFGIDKDSERFKYYTVSKAVEYLCNYINNNNIKTILEIGTAIGYSSICFSNSANSSSEKFNRFFNKILFIILFQSHATAKYHHIHQSF